LHHLSLLVTVPPLATSIAEDNPIRVVDVFVDELRLPELGFDGAEPAATGRPSYHPAVLLKINRDKNFTDRKLQARTEQLEDSVKRYLAELDRADRDATAVLPSRVDHLKEKIAKIKEQMKTLGEIGEQMKASEDGQSH